MSTIPLTKRGAESLKAELHRLKTVERHAVVQAIAEARAQGDLSENAEYDAAKDKQGFIEGRILEIEGKLAAAQIIDPSTLDAGGRVVFGATVDLEDEDSGNAVTYQITGDDEADIKQGRISIGSPIARALIGKEAGDVAEVQARAACAATRSSKCATSDVRPAPSPAGRPLGRLFAVRGLCRSAECVCGAGACKCRAVRRAAVFRRGPGQPRRSADPDAAGASHRT